MGVEYSIILSDKVAYREHHCTESPWGSYQIFNPEIADWLDARLAPNKWDHDIDFDTQNCIVTIEDKDVALLFKLTWV